MINTTNNTINNYQKIIVFRNVLISLATGWLLLWNSSGYNTGIIASISCIGLTLLIFILLNDCLFDKKYFYIILSFSSILLILITICQCSYFNFYNPEHPCNQLLLWKSIFYNYIILSIISLYACGFKKTLLNMFINVISIFFCVYKLNIIAAIILCIELIIVLGNTFIKKYLKRANKKHIKQFIMTIISSVIAFIVTYYFLDMIIQKSCHKYTYVEISLLLSFFIILGLIFTSFIIGKLNAFEVDNKSWMLFYVLFVLIGIRISFYLAKLNFITYLPFNLSQVLGDLLNNSLLYYISEIIIFMLIVLCYFWFYKNWCKLIRSINPNVTKLYKRSIWTYLKTGKKDSWQDLKYEKDKE